MFSGHRNNFGLKNMSICIKKNQMFRDEKYYQADDSGVSEFSELMDKVLEYLATPVTTGLVTGYACH